MKQDTHGIPQPKAGEIHRRVAESLPQILAGRLDEPLKLIDPEIVDHRGGTQGDHRGIGAWREKWERMSQGGAFQDVSLTIEQNVVSGDTSVNRYSMRGSGPGGRPYEVYGIDMVRVRDGRIVEHWALLDTDGLRAQTGR